MLREKISAGVNLRVNWTFFNFTKKKKKENKKKMNE